MPTPSASEPLTPGPALVARFRGDVGKLGVSPAANAPLALAVSGGPDSMAMLALAHAAFPGEVVAATVDHQLRPANVDEAALVQVWCEGAGISHQTMTVADAPAAGENLQAWARNARYRLLEGWALAITGAALVTAHHLDDLAETFLMRANRGAGLSGLAGVRSRRDDMVVAAIVRENDGSIVVESPLATIRPLLTWRRSELREIARQAKLPFVDDPSNDDPRFDRTGIRKLMANAVGLNPGQLARSALNLAAIDADLRAFALRLWEERALPAEGYAKRLDVTGLPRTLRRHLAIMAIDLVAQLTGKSPVVRNIEALLDALSAGSSATQGHVLASADGDVWHFREAPPRRSPKPGA